MSTLVHFLFFLYICYFFFFFFFFFFSSRRRHTRWNCDWSSDVCSSDLRSSTDDDRPDETPGTLLLADDDPAAHGRGGRAAVRRRHPDPGVADEPRRLTGDGGDIRSADRGRAADHPGPRRFHPVAHERGTRLGAA